MFQAIDLLPPPENPAQAPPEGWRGAVSRGKAHHASRDATRPRLRPMEVPASLPARVVPPEPGSPAPTPLVVLIHGGCQAPADYAGAAAIFARHGFHVALLREHCPGPGLQPFPVRPGPGLPSQALERETCEESLMTRLDDVLASYPVDAGRVFVAGFSQGGRLTLRLALLHPARFRGAVPIAGPLAPEDVPPGGCLPVPPLLVCHSPQDRVVPAEWSRDGLALLSSRGVYPEFRPFPGGHVLEAPLIEGIARWMVALLRD